MNFLPGVFDKATEKFYADIDATELEKLYPVSSTYPKMYTCPDAPKADLTINPQYCLFKYNQDAIDFCIATESCKSVLCFGNRVRKYCSAKPILATELIKEYLATSKNDPFTNQIPINNDPSNQTTQKGSNSNDLSVGSLIAIVVPIVVLVIVMIVLTVLCFILRKRRDSQKTKETLINDNASTFFTGSATFATTSLVSQVEVSSSRSRKSEPPSYTPQIYMQDKN